MTDRFVVGVVAGAFGLIGGMAANSALLAMSSNAAAAPRKPIYRAGFECHDGNAGGLNPAPPSNANIILIGLSSAAPMQRAAGLPAH